MVKNQFNIGDVVRLKSGGPNMTIVYVNDDDYGCDWFVEQKRAHYSFPHLSVVLADNITGESN
jgi:uncharacterized protein YodC (DUF2158 family)